MNLEKNEILLGKRKGSHGAGTWSFPGGHIEKFETLDRCAMREIWEEIGLSIFFDYKLIDENSIAETNDFFREEDKHYITLYLRAIYKTGEIKNIEPDKCEEWRWYEWGKFPDNLFTPVRNLLRQNYNPFK